MKLLHTSGPWVNDLDNPHLLGGDMVTIEALAENGDVVECPECEKPIKIVDAYMVVEVDRTTEDLTR